MLASIILNMAIVNKKAMVIAPESSDSQESNINLNFLALGISSFAAAIWVVCNFCCGLPSINLSGKYRGLKPLLI